MHIAKKTVEFLIDGQWSVFEEHFGEYDAYKSLRRRQGNVDLPHMKRTFSRGVKTEILTISNFAEVTTCKITTAWSKEGMK